MPSPNPSTAHDLVERAGAIKWGSGPQVAAGAAPGIPVLCPCPPHLDPAKARRAIEFGRTDVRIAPQPSGHPAGRFSCRALQALLSWIAGFPVMAWPESPCQGRVLRPARLGVARGK